jgi:sterol 24-C-methyltransferase
MSSFQNIQFVQGLMNYVTENLVVVVAATTLFGVILLFSRKESLKRDTADYNSIAGVNKLFAGKEHTLKEGQFESTINDYQGMFAGARETTGAITADESIEERKERYASMVDHFYNIVTDFYEYGWGQSFHFAPRWKNETFLESIKRAEYYLASRLGLKKGMTCLDVGCGVGGPMRNIAGFSDAKITGVTINQYQVKIGNTYNTNTDLTHLCHITQGDFQNLQFPDNTFDGAYEIEATCHSPNRIACFSGIHRVLKPGAKFCGYEWVMLDRYDPNNQEHVRIKEGIEVGNALPTLVHYTEVIRNLEAAGFIDIEFFNANEGAHSPSQIPWYDGLSGEMSLSGFRMTHLGRLCTHCMVWILETLHIAPPGSTKISALLNATAIDLVDGGRAAIFTPSFFFIGTKK